MAADCCRTAVTECFWHKDNKYLAVGKTKFPIKRTKKLNFKFQTIMAADCYRTAVTECWWHKDNNYLAVGSFALISSQWDNCALHDAAADDYNGDGGHHDGHDEEED